MSDSRTTTHKNKNKLFIISIIVIIICIAGSVFLLCKSLKNAEKACQDNFNTAYAETKQKTYEQFKQKAFDYFEKENHVSNQTTLTIGNIKEENSLEVLSVSDSWVKISEPDNDSDRTTRWVEFNATGVYIVDMSVSEFIIDDYNNYVLVKLKTPQLSNIALDNSGIKVYNYDYEEGFLKINGDYDKGVKLAINDRSEALDKLTEQLENNDTNLEIAKNSAKNLIRTFIKNVNLNMNLKDSDIQIVFK